VRKLSTTTFLHGVDRQVFSHLQESRAPSHVTVTWEDKRHYSKSPPPSSPMLYMLSTMSYGVECPFGQLVSAVPPVHPQPPRWWGGLSSRKGLDSA